MKQLHITPSVTVRDRCLEKYLQEIDKIDLLTPEQEVELVQKIKQGNEQALERFTKANLRFVVSVAKQYQHKGLSLSDLINEGNLGLIKAAKKFDATKGFKFISYAVRWIRESILSAIAKHGKLIRVPINELENQRKINKEINRFEQTYDRRPKLAELADITGKTEEEISYILQGSTTHTSLDKPLLADEEVTLGEILSSENEKPTDYITIQHSLQNVVAAVLTTLPPTEQEVIQMLFGIGGEDPCSHKEIAEKLSISVQQVKNMEAFALRRIRNSGDRMQLLGLV